MCSHLPGTGQAGVGALLCPAEARRQESGVFVAPLPRRRNPPPGAAGTALGSAHQWETGAVAQAAKTPAGSPSKPAKVLGGVVTLFHKHPSPEVPFC